MKRIVACGLGVLGLVLVVLFGITSTGSRCGTEGDSALERSQEIVGPLSSSATTEDQPPATRQLQPCEPSLLSGIEAETDANRRSESIQRAADFVPDTQLRATLDALLGDPSPAAVELSQVLVRRWAEQNPSLAAAWAEHLSGGPFQGEAFRQVAIAWGNADLSAALAWVNTLPEDLNRQEAVVSLAYEASRTEALVALEMMRTFPAGSERDNLLSHAVSEWAMMDWGSAKNWASSMLDPELRGRLLAAVAVATAERDGAAAAALVASSLPAGPAQERAAVAVAQRWAEKAPQEAASWVSRFPDGSARASAVQNVVTLWTEQDSGAAAAWLHQLPEGAASELDQAVLEQTSAQGESLGKGPYPLSP